jgi:hypothetical protein
MKRMFHLSSAANRESILAYGLDWTRMGAARGIAGSTAPEVAGVFLCRDEGEARLFAEMNNTGGPVDLWAVTGVSDEELITSPEGFSYVPTPIPAARVTLASSTDQQAHGPGPGRRPRKRKPRNVQPPD